MAYPQRKSLGSFAVIFVVVRGPASVLETSTSTGVPRLQLVVHAPVPLYARRRRENFG